MLRLSLPAILAQVVSVLYNIVDRINIGHIQNASSLALTWLGVCLPVIIFWAKPIASTLSALASGIILLLFYRKI